MKKIRLLSAFGLSEQASWIAIGVVISALVGISMMANFFGEFGGHWLGFVFFGVAFAVAYFYNFRSKNLAFNPTPVGAKKYLISIAPSNTGLLNKIIGLYSDLVHIYFIYDGSSKIDDIKQAIQHDKRYILKKVKSTIKPENIIAVFDEILEELKEFLAQEDDIVIEVTAGLTMSSITLYQLGKTKNIDVSCNISQYDERNQPIPNSGVATRIAFDLKTQEQ